MRKLALGAVCLAATGAVVAFAIAPQFSEPDPEIYDLASHSVAKFPTELTTLSPDDFELPTVEKYIPEPEPEPEPEPAPAPAPPPAPAAPPAYTGGGSSAEWMAAAGIPESDWGYVDFIVTRESSWNPNAVNPSSGASGLVQALPCGKVPGNCFDPVDNLRWANGYAQARYGSWAGAVEFWQNNRWW